MKLQLLCLISTLTACGPAFSTSGEATDPATDGGMVIGTSSGMTPDSTSGLLDGSSAGSSMDDGSETMIDTGSPGLTKSSDGSPADVDAGTDKPAPDSGSTCTPIPAHAECAAWYPDAGTGVNGATFDSTLASGGCLIFTTPPTCQCAETYNCACVVQNAHTCHDLGGTITGCTMQSNGVPLVSCQ